ncbi:MAG: hypothetical protein ACFB11_24555 [Paracoccaceae bacterium]
MAGTAHATVNEVFFRNAANLLVKSKKQGQGGICLMSVKRRYRVGGDVGTFCR